MAALGLLLTGSPSPCGAASDVPIPTGSGQSSWLHPWGGAYVNMSYDAGQDALQVQANHVGGDDNYIVGTVAGCNGWIGCGPAIDGTLYESIEMDLMFASTNTIVLSTSGSIGFQVGFDHGYSFTTLKQFLPHL